MWGIWKDRNKCLFEHQPISAREIVEKAIQMTKDYSSNSNFHSEQKCAIQDHNYPEKWMALPKGNLKINVDGVEGGQSIATVIICDHSKLFINEETTALNPCSPEEAEVLAFLMGLKQIEKLPQVPTIIEGDSMMIVHLLTDKLEYCPWRIKSIISDCHHLLD